MKFTDHKAHLTLSGEDHEVGVLSKRKYRTATTPNTSELVYKWHVLELDLCITKIMNSHL